VIQQHRLRWYGHVLRKGENDWVKECMDDEVEVVRPRDRPKKTWSKVIEKDCQTQQLCKEDDVDSRKWRKLINDVVVSRRVWVSECFFSGTGSLGSSWIRAIKQVVVVVVVVVVNVCSSGDIQFVHLFTRSFLIVFELHSLFIFLFASWSMYFFLDLFFFCHLC